MLKIPLVPNPKTNISGVSVPLIALVSIQNVAVLLLAKHVPVHVSMFSAIQETVEHVEILYVIRHIRHALHSCWINRSRSSAHLVPALMENAIVSLHKNRAIMNAQIFRLMTTIAVHVVTK